MTAYPFRTYPTAPLLSKEQLKPSDEWYCTVIKRNITVCNATVCKMYPCK
ncbi:MAG: hypothetical protein KAJ39_09415 [Gammaproteobacteria bacterium]|nr:hypothetical protein [Gammaproteobacteria bacterium]